MIKTYILDTNVLLHNPNALFSFEDNNVILPDVVIDELDNHKRDKGKWVLMRELLQDILIK